MQQFAIIRISMDMNMTIDIRYASTQYAIRVRLYGILRNLILINFKQACIVWHKSRIRN